jgi:hypothetical protein
MHVKDSRILDKFAGMTDAASGKPRPNQSALSVLLTVVFLILSTSGCGGDYSNPTRTSSSLVAIFVNGYVRTHENNGVRPWCPSCKLFSCEDD